MQPLINQVRDRLEPKLVQALSGALERASWHQCRLIGAWVGLALNGALGTRRQIAVANIRLALPHLSEAAASQIARRSAMNIGMTFAEFVHLRGASPAEIRRHASIEGLEHIQRGLDAGRGVILLCAHLGNWEVMGARAAQEFPLTVVARPTGNSKIEEHIAQVRQAAGVEVISKYDAGRAALRVLQNNGALGILADQYAWPDGMLLPMFGQPTRFVPALARLAMLSGATVVPAFGVRSRPWMGSGRIVAKVSQGWTVENPGKDPAAREATIEAATRRMVGELEKVVKTYPDQWLWMHRRWRPEDGADVSAVLCPPRPSPKIGPG